MFFDRKIIASKLNKPPEEVILGFTASTFDLLHAGHAIMLAESKSLCDYLVVGLLVDPTVDRPNKNAPVQSVFERYVQLSSIKYVDEVVPFQTEKDLVDLILTIRPDIRIVGEEYKGQEHTGVGLCKIHYNDRRHSFSTSELRIRVKEAS
jgi:glycerol-3-phosphate cytidylyltransferase